MELTVVPIVKPDAANFIFGQSHFIKTVEDLHEALVGAVPRPGRPLLARALLSTSR